MSETVNTATEMRESDEKPKRLLPGRRLRAAREALGISITEAAGHLRLDPQLITALEEDKYDSLPGAAYVCGYLRAYARVLKLPENEVVQAFTQGQVVEAALIPENVNLLPPKRGNIRLIRTVILFVVMGLVAGGFLWLAEQFHLFEHKTTTTRIQLPAQERLDAPVATPEAPPTAPVVPPPAAEPGKDSFIPPGDTSQRSGTSEIAQVKPVKTTNRPAAEINLKYTADSWTEIKDASGERLIFRLVEKDSVVTLRGEPPLWVLLGYANGVEVYYQGKRYDHMQHVQDDVAIFTLGRS